MTLLVDIVAVILTLLVLSRIIGDNPLFRVAQYMFVGVSLGYAFVIIFHQVLMPAATDMIASSNNPLLFIGRIIPFALGLLFFPRIMGRQQLSWLANIPLGFIFGVSAAVALSGALVGTLLPQVLDTISVTLNGSVADVIGGIVLMIAVVLVLSYFYFTVPKQAGLMRVSGMSARMGRGVLIVTFGFFFASALTTYLTALSDRLQFLVSWLQGLVS